MCIILLLLFCFLFIYFYSYKEFDHSVLFLDYVSVVRDDILQTASNYVKIDEDFAETKKSKKHIYFHRLQIFTPCFHRTVLLL